MNAIETPLSTLEVELNGQKFTIKEPTNFQGVAIVSKRELWTNGKYSELATSKLKEIRFQALKTDAICTAYVLFDDESVLGLERLYGLLGIPVGKELTSADSANLKPLVLLHREKIHPWLEKLRALEMDGLNDLI